MFPGFIPGSRATLMLDLVAVAMVLVLPVLTLSIFAVKRYRDYAAHKRVQLGLGITLLVAVILFEVDIRVFGWRHLATASPYYGNLLDPVLYVHLFFSIATTFLWAVTIVQAVRRFPVPIRPSEYSRTHARLGWISAIFMYCTAITGWTFYWMAFVAK